MTLIILLVLGTFALGFSVCSYFLRISELIKDKGVPFLLGFLNKISTAFCLTGTTSYMPGKSFVPGNGI